MNVLFMSLGSYSSVNCSSIYTDLLRVFIAHGDDVVLLCPTETPKSAGVTIEPHAKIVKVFTGRIQKTNIIRKGINTVLLEARYKKAVKKLVEAHFDLVLYPTPPITLAGVVGYIKKRDHAATYLLLKDIFPQNAVDMGMLCKTGLKGLLYRYFRRKEKKLYALSDRIGCMSPANVSYLLQHNPSLPVEKVEVCPNCIEPTDIHLSAEQRNTLRSKYELPPDKKVFLYGGNLGKVQGIPFILQCLKTQLDNPAVFFLIAGEGTEKGKLEAFMKEYCPRNIKLLKQLPKDDYDRLAAACDIGLIFLDHCFTIPNFPSRLLSYMQAGLPVLACTDSSSDIGQLITDGGYGWWCESNDATAFARLVQSLQTLDTKPFGKRAREQLQADYTAETAYRIVAAGAKQSSLV